MCYVLVLSTYTSSKGKLDWCTIRHFFGILISFFPLQCKVSFPPGVLDGQGETVSSVQAAGGAGAGLTWLISVLMFSSSNIYVR